jgi:hypothetical protein
LSACQYQHQELTHLIVPGRIIGSLARLRSTSSIRATFHFRRRICHTPRKPVRIGTKMRTSVVGFSSCDLVVVAYVLRGCTLARSGLATSRGRERGKHAAQDEKRMMVVIDSEIAFKVKDGCLTPVEIIPKCRRGSNQTNNIIVNSINDGDGEGQFS